MAVKTHTSKYRLDPARRGAHRLLFARARTSDGSGRLEPSPAGWAPPRFLSVPGLVPALAPAPSLRGNVRSTAQGAQLLATAAPTPTRGHRVRRPRASVLEEIKGASGIL